MDTLYLFAQVNFVPGQYDHVSCSMEVWKDSAFDSDISGKQNTTSWPNTSGKKSRPRKRTISASHSTTQVTSPRLRQCWPSRSMIRKRYACLLGLVVRQKLTKSCSQSLYNVHLKSPAMQAFLPNVLPSMSTGLDLMNYSLASGFLDFPGDKRECGVMQDTRIRTNSKETRKAVLDRLAKLASDVEMAEGKESNGVYTFGIFSNQDDDTGIRIFSRFRDRDAMEQHIRRSSVLDFWQQSKDDIVQMESRGYLPNGKGWLHR
jgi:quinol monooxygenase YgiN